MADIKELTKKIQRLVGSRADGIYGKNTANSILKKIGAKPEVLKVVVKPKPTPHPLDELMAPAPKKVKVSFWSKLFASFTKQVPTKQDVTTNYSEVYKSTPNKSVRKIVPDSDVSYHVLIDTDGSRTVFAKDNERAWHAGTSEFNGRYGCNGFMIGLAFSNDTETRELTDAEVASAVEFMLPRFDKWGWPKDLSTITTHRAVAPNRKVDVDVRAEDKILKALAKAIK